MKRRQTFIDKRIEIFRFRVSSHQFYIIIIKFIYFILSLQNQKKQRKQI